MGTITGSPVAGKNAIEPLECETPPHPDGDSIVLADVLHALSDPVRLRIVAALSNGSELTCGAIDLPVVKSTCTHHFRVLREAGRDPPADRGNDEAQLAPPRRARVALPGTARGGPARLRDPLSGAQRVRIAALAAGTRSR